ncbi:transporter substrate-binding domain-containing protein [Rhodospira trueperi]|uniref:histidine kinase n=1 Tax=Rhodospira trueperi TaxID=69960 RepID=A0A1G7A313_9PROT|nr:transporter substrate-binding domain-containing protein [Rhodospira trueperi]SDE09294.1 PAS domain S-box-containing protein [Rhodospira trueperi]
MTGAARFLRHAFFALMIVGGCQASTLAVADTTPTGAPVVAAVPTQFPPYYTLGNDGEPGGYAVDVFNAIARRAGLHVVYQPHETWSDVHAALETGAADVVPNMGISARRAAFATFTTPIEQFDVVVVQRAGDDAMVTPDDLAGHAVGTMRTNVAASLLSSREEVNLRTYSTAREVLDALLLGEIDAFALPRPLVTDLTEQVRVSDQVRILETPLVTVQRAVAVSKDRPDLLPPLNAAIAAFIGSSEHAALQTAWGRPGTPALSLATKAWAAALAVSAVVVVLVFLTGRSKGASPQLTISEIDGYTLRRRLRQRGLVLTTILAVSIAAMVGIALVLLYQVAFERHRERLVELVSMQVELFESVAAFDTEYGTDYPGGAAAATLRQIKEALGRHQGVGEFTLARRDGDQIAFILRQKAWDRYEPAPVPLDSGLAEPMREALTGRSGTMIGQDYRGVTVLAAYGHVPSLDLGMVAKEDIAEIRAPFIEAGLTAGAIGFLVIVLGAAGFVSIGNPLVRQLVERERWFAATVQHAGVGIALVDVPSGRIAKANARFAAILGVPESTVASASVADLCPELGIATDPRHLGQLVTDESGTHTSETHFTRSDGPEVWVQTTASIVARAGDQPMRLVLVVDDISDVKRAEALREDIERIIRHDMRSPITAMRSGIELLRMSDALSEDQRRTLDMMERANRWELTMLDTSMTLSRIESGAFTPEPTPLDLDTVLHEVTEEIRHLMDQRKTGIHLTVAPDTRVLGDVWLCRTLFSNLIRNALEALPDSGQTVDIAAAPDGGEAVIRITNPGAVPEVIRDRFFEKYVTAGKTGGTGLGTYSARMMVRAQGGTIALDASDPGRTTIRVRLPLAPAE